SLPDSVGLAFDREQRVEVECGGRREPEHEDALLFGRHRQAAIELSSGERTSPSLPTGSFVEADKVGLEAADFVVVDLVTEPAHDRGRRASSLEGREG